METTNETEPELSLDSQLCFAIYSTANAFTRLYNKRLAKLGITFQQHLVLLVLWEKNGTSMKELGEGLRLPSPALGPLLRRMENDGLISRHRDNCDKRLILVWLTQKGEMLRGGASLVPGNMASQIGLSIPAMMDTKERVTAVRERLEIAEQTGF